MNDIVDDRRIDLHAPEDFAGGSCRVPG